MLRATLVAAAVICLAGHLEFAAAGGPPPVQATCEPKGGTTLTELPTYGVVNIVCPENSTLEPAVAQDPHVFSSEKGESPVALAELLPGATLKAVEKSTSKATLRIVQLPAAPQNIFFACRAAARSGAEKDCFIHVRVPGSPPLGPNACAVPSAEVKFHVKAANDAVRFACGDGAQLTPDGANKALDQNCQDQVDISALVPDAALTRPTKEGELATLTVPKLPKQATVLCYQCAKGKEVCTIKIEVYGGDSGSAVGLHARNASALCIIALAAGLVRMF